MKSINLTGQKFGKLVVIRKAEKDKWGNYQWECKCDCGKHVIVRGFSLRKGKTKSCGCLKGKHRHTKHNKKERIYVIWDNMKQRCKNPNNPAYKHYGGRGIAICNEWLSDFINFYNWSMEHGYQENLTIDRIDANGNYEPTNCRWVDMKKQQNNRTNNHYINYNNQIHTLKEWSEILRVAETTIQKRLKRGKNIEGF